MKHWKKWWYVLLILIGFISILDSLFLFFISNVNVGTVFPGLLGLILVVYSKLKLLRYKDKPIITNQVYRRIFFIGMFVFILSFVGVEAAIILNSYQDERINTDYVFILGAGVDGDTVSLTLKERLDKGMEYLRFNPDSKVVVTGGKGFNTEISEAHAMKVYLINKGLQKDRIIMEDKSTSTMENFKYSKEILNQDKSNSINEITVITSDFHMMRSKMLASRNGFKAYGITCKTPMIVRVNSYIREYFAVIKSYLFDRN